MPVCRCRYTLTIAALVGSCLPLAPALASPPSSDYKLVFGDEFSGSSLDTLKWNYNYTWGNTHNHSAYMDPSQVIVGNGVLNLQAINQRHPNATDFWHNDFGWQAMNYTSGAINTSGKFNATQGYFEASIKLPDSAGSWPAFWMLQNGWPPEIDIMEFPHASGGADDVYHAYYHYTNSSGNHDSFGNTRDTNVNLTTGYHTYGMEWTASSMSFFIDGTRWYTNNSATAIAQAAGMYMILNHAVAGWAGTPTASEYPADYLIDWVRVWQKPTTTSTTVNWNSTSTSGSWDTTSKWDVMVPKYQDVTARFASNDNAAVSVTWDYSRTVGGLEFDSATSFTIGDGNASLQLSRSNGLANINVAATNSATQNINARLELHSNTTITNESASALWLWGVITGDGALTLEGAGTTVFANNNTYTGNTIIDGGSQGPAVARVTRSRPFGSVGTVTIGAGGNNTTARIEILDDREVPNPISLTGRNNSTPAIQNISGNNLFSGTISAQSGGGNYIIQSDAGLLTLSGGTTAANGVALRAQAGGSRTFTLQGAGNGSVTGAIQNGNATVSIIKAGVGTWTFAGTNTYTGATAITAGTLIVNGTHNGGGAYVVTEGAALGGSGVIDPSGTNAVTIQGSIAPGNSIGTLIVGSAGSTNNVVISDGGELVVEVGAAGAADLLVVNGTLDLSAADDVLHLVSTTGAFDRSDYTIATFTAGTLGGQAFNLVYLDNVLQSSTTLLSNGYQVVYDDLSGQINLVSTPEPASLALLGMIAPMLWRQRARGVGTTLRRPSDIPSIT